MAIWQELLTNVTIAKRLPDALYLHRDTLPLALGSVVENAHQRIGAPPYTLLKLFLESPRLSFLDYPDFEQQAFPALQRSTTVDLLSFSYSSRNYEGDSAPILHRKELLLPSGDDRFREWSALTHEAEELGLFAYPTLIGTVGGWKRRLAEVGYRVEGHELLPIDQSPESIQRHLTAIVRYNLSTPMQALLQHGFLNGSYTVFDYGCGRGGDLAQMSALNVNATGWDPFFAPDQPKTSASVVNLGFVLNVIEDPIERVTALKGAWTLATRLLVVAVLIGGRSAWEKHRLYRDGVITSKGTFQKYFSQDELRSYLQQHTGRSPIAMAPGLFFVFRNDEDEQSFLIERLTRRPRVPKPPSLPRPERLTRPDQEPRPDKAAKPHRPPKPTPWDTHGPIWEAFWEQVLSLGRLPEEEELDPAVKLAGGAAKSLRACIARFGEQPLAEARTNRMADLGVWLALGAFERRGAYNTLSRSLQRDIRTFWGSWSKAQDAGRALLFSAGETKNLIDAAEHAAGWQQDGALYVLGNRIQELPAVLRVVVGCASVLYGVVDSAAVLKIHLKGGKVSLLNFDDFEQPIPNLVERVKIDLRRQELQFFSYDGNPYLPQPFWHKAKLLPSHHPTYERLRRLEARLDALDLPTNVDRPAFDHRLTEEGLELHGFSLIRRLPQWVE